MVKKQTKYNYKNSIKLIIIINSSKRILVK